jgi:hypothetical protein
MTRQLYRTASEAMSRADGTFQMTVPAGLAHLLAISHDKDFVVRTTSAGQLTAGKPGGDRRFFNAVLPLDLKPGDGPKEVTLTLRRGVTLRGRVVGPDGNPVRQAAMIVPDEFLLQDTAGAPPVYVYPYVDIISSIAYGLPADGQFELRGCDPDKTYRVCFADRLPGGTYRPPQRLFDRGMRMAGALGAEDGPSPDLKSHLGAVVELSAKRAGGKPITVELKTCGSAEVRLVDPRGKAVRRKVYVKLVAAPKEKGLAEETYLLRTFTPDDQGWLTIPGLIAGAVYRIEGFPEGAKIVLNSEIPLERVFEREFTVEAGKTRKLGDLVVSK